MSEHGFRAGRRGSRARFTRRERIRMGREATELRSAGPTGNRRCGAEKCPGRDRRGTPTTPKDEDRAASSDDAGNRVSVNGAEGPTGPGNRQTGAPSPAAEPARAVEAVGGLSGNGGRPSGRSTGSGRGRHRATDGAPKRRRSRVTGRPGLDSGDGGRFAGRGSRGGTWCRVRPGAGAEGSRAGFARSTGRKTGIARRIPSGNRRAMWIGRNEG